jgi:hypothetical protein
MNQDLEHDTMLLGFRFHNSTGSWLYDPLVLHLR